MIKILILFKPDSKQTTSDFELSIFYSFLARRWLEQPELDDRGLGRQAIALVVEDGLKIATVLPGEGIIYSLSSFQFKYAKHIL